MSSFSRFGAAIAVSALLAAGGIPAAGQTTADRDALVEALAAAKRESAQIERRYEQAQQDCAGQFAVNPCRERARAERDEQLRQARARELEAGDALRRLDAEARARQREQRGAEGRDRSRPADAPAARPSAPSGPAARSPSSPRVVDPSRPPEADAEQRQAKARRQAAEQAEAQERRAADRATKETEAPGRIEEYGRRQREAEARAEQKAQEAERQRQRRERRAQEREEANRKRAAETAK
jgi:colicin import membrane protein